MKSRVLTTQQSQTTASGNAAHNAARVLCAAPLSFVFLFDLTRAGELLESAGGWAALLASAFVALNGLRAVMLLLEPVVLLWFAPAEFPRLWDTWTKIIKSIDLLTASFPRQQKVTNALFHADRERKGLPPVEWTIKGGERGPNQ